MRDIVVTLSVRDQEDIIAALQTTVDNQDTVHVLIQEDGLKFKHNYGIWTPPIGDPEVR